MEKEFYHAQGPGTRREIGPVPASAAGFRAAICVVYLETWAFDPGTPLLVEPIISTVSPEVLSYPDLEYLPIGGGPIELHFQNPSQPKPPPNVIQRFLSALGRKLRSN